LRNILRYWMFVSPSRELRYRFIIIELRVVNIFRHKNELDWALTLLFPLRRKKTTWTVRFVIYCPISAAEFFFDWVDDCSSHVWRWWASFIDLRRFSLWSSLPTRTCRLAMFICDLHVPLVVPSDPKREPCKASAVLRHYTPLKSLIPSYVFSLIFFLLWSAFRVPESRSIQPLWLRFSSHFYRIKKHRRDKTFLWRKQKRKRFSFRIVDLFWRFSSVMWKSEAERASERRIFLINI
jgi:hypothetical protein